MEITQFVSHYGPLGFGWIAAIFLFRENLKLQERVYQFALTDIEVKTAMTQRLKEMAEIIRKGFGDA